MGRVLGCRSRIVFLRKTGAVLRFFEHGCAARFGKVRIPRGICVEKFLDLFWGRDGSLITAAQRADFMADYRPRCSDL
jgi:hypothetical protein